MIGALVVHVRRQGCYAASRIKECLQHPWGNGKTLGYARAKMSWQLLRSDQHTRKTVAIHVKLPKQQQQLCGNLVILTVNPASLSTLP